MLMKKLCFVGLVCVLFSCARKHQAKLLSPVDTNFYSVQHIEIHNLGCSGLLIKRGSDVFAIDPFFSNQSVPEVVGRIHVKPESIKTVMFTNMKKFKKKVDPLRSTAEIDFLKPKSVVFF